MFIETYEKSYIIFIIKNNNNNKRQGDFFMVVPNPKDPFRYKADPQYRARVDGVALGKESMRLGADPLGIATKETIIFFICGFIVLGLILFPVFILGGILVLCVGFFIVMGYLFLTGQLSNNNNTQKYDVEKLQKAKHMYPGRDWESFEARKNYYNNLGNKKKHTAKYEKFLEERDNEDDKGSNITTYLLFIVLLLVILFFEVLLLFF